MTLPPESNVATMVEQSCAAAEMESTARPLTDHRLEACDPQEVLAAEWFYVEPPQWLRQLALPCPRTNVSCLNRRTRIAKRTLDIVVASLLLVATAPLIAVAACIIKISSPGPILFSQVRAGLNVRRREIGYQETSGVCRRSQSNHGRPFRIFKLRTMHLQASAAGPSQAQVGDQRIIPAGRWLRKMRIDELPQLVNVLRGDMSMVGPRPECVEYMDELNQKIPGYSQRLGLKPGLTGIAQIESGYANDLES
ncbi:MAG: sugar transferase, partial [Planctomycetales bacterium]|nr:sugar transferase [Planctomycetales bacterium]